MTIKPSRWLPSPPSSRIGLVMLLLLPLSCGAARSNSALLGGQACGSGDVGGWTECVALGDRASRIYMDGGGGSFDPATGVVTWSGATAVDIVHGPAAVTGGGGNEALGEALNSAVGALVQTNERALESLEVDGPEPAGVADRFWAEDLADSGADRE